MTSIFEARRAGQMPAMTPAIPASDQDDDDRDHRDAEDEALASSAWTAATPIAEADQRRR